DFDDVTFDDYATTSILAGAAPFVGSFIPNQPLGTLIGKSLAGAWTLKVEDLHENNFGTLVYWRLNAATTQVLNATTEFIDVTFDRDIVSSTFQPGNVVRMVGPVGPVDGPFVVTPIVSGVPTGDAPVARTFRVSFPTQQLSGSYNLTLGPD